MMGAYLDLDDVATGNPAAMKQLAALRLMLKSHEERIAGLMQDQALWFEARATLESERAANARLTDLVERLTIDLGIRDGRIVAGHLVIPAHRAHLCRTSYLIGYADALDNIKAEKS